MKVINENKDVINSVFVNIIFLTFHKTYYRDEIYIA
jgi:hypothetical protein